jgi:hypothetical protein
MPMHDWTQVEDCIFDAFHHGWISAISDMLNMGLLPEDYYALVEAEIDTAFYRRKKSAIAIRHVSDDRLVAMIEIVLPGNKSSRRAFRAFVGKACKLLEHRIHLLVPAWAARSQRRSRSNLGRSAGRFFRPFPGQTVDLGSL